MGITPTELFKFSDELLEGPSEVHHRSAASRAFLAVYHIVNDFFYKDLKVIRSRGTTYRSLLSDLAGYDGEYGTSFTLKVRGLELPFKDLQTIRTRADYKLRVIFTKNEAKDAIVQAKAIETLVMEIGEEIQQESP